MTCHFAGFSSLLDQVCCGSAAQIMEGEFFTALSNPRRHAILPS
jgi:hypothetical protein